MSLRLKSSASQLYVSQWGGLGIPGAEVPATGDNGASPLYNDGLTSTSEYRIVTTTTPSAGTLTVYPDTSFSFSGAPDGTYSWVFTLYEDGASVGSETVTLIVGAVAQYARPTAEVTTGTWVSSLGGSLAAAIDETTANDTDYISTTYASICEVALGTLTDPAVSTGHKVRYRIAADSGAIVVRLRQGTTTIASWTHNPAPTSLTTFEQTLSGAEADSITDYTALKIQFEAY